MDEQKKRFHPWELIYKNLYECILQQHRDDFNADRDEAKYIRSRALTCVCASDYTIQMIQIHTKLLFEQMENETRFECCSLSEFLTEEEIALSEKSANDIVGVMTPIELKEWLDKKMNCYMYS